MVRYKNNSTDNLEVIKKGIRKTILEASFLAGACHIGSSLSCSDILVDLYFKRMKREDIFLFSKASGSCALYAVLEKKGIIPKNKVAYYLRKYPLASKEVPGVIHSVGSVGMGLSVAVGLALSNRKRKVYCLISDGQLDEGITYESALFARQYRLDNLYVICDNNGLQALGRTKDILDLKTAIDFYKKTFPNFENVKTIKGFPIPFMMGKTEWHYRNLDDKLLAEALKWI